MFSTIVSIMFIVAAITTSITFIHITISINIIIITDVGDLGWQGLILAVLTWTFYPDWLEPYW